MIYADKWNDYELLDCSDGEKLEKLLVNVLEAVSYEDAIYFEAAGLLDKTYYLNQIILRTHEDESRKKAEQLLGGEEENGNIGNKDKILTKVHRQIPKSIDDFFEDEDEFDPLDEKDVDEKTVKDTFTDVKEEAEEAVEEAADAE